MSHDARSDLDALRTSDEFLTALPHGADPSAGEDELAGLLLDARRDIEAPMPDAPDVTAVASGASAGDAPAHGGASVTELAPRHRHARHQRGHFSLKNHPLVSGMIGAAAATLLIAALEWRGFLAGMPLGAKWLNAFFSGVTPRTAGFNAIDYGQANPVTRMGTDVLMFIGGGSAGTAGGIKITTVIVLLAAMVAEFTGRDDTAVGHRTVPKSVVRQAMTVAAAGVGAVTLAVGALRILEPQFTADQISFEVISAFATSGLSTGITAQLNTPAQLILCLLMYLGRVGPFTLVAALATRNLIRRFDYPIERPFIG